MSLAETSLRAGRRRVRITHPDRLMFPRDGITKLDLATYYRDVARAMVRHARDRPIAMQRFNDGIEGEAFFQKEIPRGAPDWIRSVRVRKEGGLANSIQAEQATDAVFAALKEQLSGGEADDIMAQLPRDLKWQWVRA